MKMTLYDFKTAKEPWFELASELYIKKISGFWPFEIIHLKTLKQSREDASTKIKFEETELIKRLNQDDFVFLFDETGKEFDSLGFSKQIENSFTSGKKRVVFIIGGAFGVSDEIKEKAHLKICLSKLVMNHVVAETVALEQIYRALTIQNRIPYHNV